MPRRESVLPELPVYLAPGPNTGVKVLLRHPEILDCPTLPPRYLALRRSKLFQPVWARPPYDLPGGLVDPEYDKNLLAAALREVNAEVGAHIGSTIDVDGAGKPIIVDTDKIPLRFLSGGEVIGVDLTRHFVMGQAYDSNIRTDEEHETGSGLWLPFHDGLLDLDFDPRLNASLVRIGARMAIDHTDL